jgi:hypothetical protein
VGFGVLKAVKMFVFRVVTPYGLVGTADTNVSEEHIASNFRCLPRVHTTLLPRRPISRIIIVTDIICWILLYTKYYIYSNFKG